MPKFLCTEFSREFLNAAWEADMDYRAEFGPFSGPDFWAMYCNR
jgi:hypothetical protein